MRVLLVCGGAGFIGSNFIQYILKNYPEDKVVNYDKLTYAGNLDNLANHIDNPNYQFIQGDICDYGQLEKVVKENEITHVINFAAETHVDRSIHGFAKDFILTNVLGVQTLLEVVKNNEVTRMIQISTDEVYGALDLDDPNTFTEESLLNPNNPYSAAKAGGDLHCRAYFKTYGLPVIVTHCSNNYGSYQFPEKMIPFFISKAKSGEKVPLYGDGLYVRDLIHVDDHNSAVAFLLEKGQDGEIYNIGVDNEISNLELTKKILKYLKCDDSMIEFVKDRPGHDRRYAINSSKLNNLGWQAKYTKENFDEAFGNTVQWYLDNQAWIDNIKSKKKNEMNDFQNKFF